MAYTTIDKPTDYFNIVLYTGNGGTQSITGVGFAPNWVWGKSRSVTEGNAVHDTVRGARKNILTNTTAAEEDIASITAFGSDGFTLGSNAHLNKNNSSMVAWNWKAGTSFTNDASSTGVGSIDSTGSVNTDAGFSIISYTGNGNSGQTIAHGLGSTVDMVIVKDRSRNGENWVIYHKSLGKDKLLLFNADAAATSSNYWGSSTPNSTVFGVKDGNTSNNWSGDNFIAYCFAGKKGYSKFGTYLGNSSTNGTFVYTGFKPAWIMVKKTNSANDEWNIFDNKRDPFNVMTKRLVANVAAADAAGTYVDFVSNGFKWRINNNLANGDGNTYIYMAFAENPFVTSTGVPATAR